MFTGIIQEIGKLETRRSVQAGYSLTVAAPMMAQRLSPGDSVSVNGVCQTVESIVSDRFSFTAVGETLKRTTLSTIRPGTAVNLESAATPETALGGHLVQGHVDGVGSVDSFARAGNDWLLAVHVPEEVAHLAVPKGSVAIDGVSLTIIDVKREGIVTITVVPFTIDHTIVKGYRRGTRVNVEADIVGKYVMEYLSRVQGGGSSGGEKMHQWRNLKR